MFGIHSILNGEDDNKNNDSPVRYENNNNTEDSTTIPNSTDTALSPKKSSEVILSTSTTPTILYSSSNDSRSNSSASSSHTSTSLPLKPASLPTTSSSSLDSVSISVPIPISNIPIKNSSTTTTTTSPTHNHNHNHNHGNNHSLNHLPRSKINKRYLKDKKFVKLAIRRKSISKKLGGNSNSLMESSINNDLYQGSNKRLTSSSNPNLLGSPPLSDPSTIASNINSPITSHSKLHIKSLEAGLRVKLTIADNLISLYHSLIPFTSKKEIQSIFENSKISSVSPASSSTSSSTPSTTSSSPMFANNPKFARKTLLSKSVQLIDNNLVNLSEYSNKILQQFNLYNSNNGNKDSSSVPVPTPASSIPTFNNLNTAVSSLFNIKDYSLIRVSRSTTDDNDGSIILKLETCKPGDLKLIDDSEYLDEMLYSLGKLGESPSNLFIKKIIARPRYKSDMKIYLIPNSTNDYSLYTDERMFERDLYNGIIDIEFDDESSEVKALKSSNRDILVTFPFQNILTEYKRLVDLSRREADEDSIEEEPEDFEQQEQKQQKELEQKQSLKVDTKLEQSSSKIATHQIATPIPSHIMPTAPPNSAYTTLAPNNHHQHQHIQQQHPQDQYQIQNRGITLPPIGQHLLSSNISSPTTPVMVQPQQQSPVPPQVYASRAAPQVQIASHPFSQQPLPPPMQHQQQQQAMIYQPQPQPQPQIQQHQQFAPHPLGHPHQQQQFQPHPHHHHQQQQQQQQQQPYPPYPYYQQQQQPSPTRAPQPYAQNPHPHYQQQ
ncbi:hypothetical protein DFJ63DRAFT_312808 [Scheffersomyces coipomensis]|uniref:uncharacterized protein n=1 Tax=Scheffersomyces coipomensis TaxID=1788519 RepID=UPI00315DEEAF